MGRVQDVWYSCWTLCGVCVAGVVVGCTGVSWGGACGPAGPHLPTLWPHLHSPWFSQAAPPDTYRGATLQVQQLWSFIQTPHVSHSSQEQMFTTSTSFTKRLETDINFFNSSYFVLLSSRCFRCIFYFYLFLFNKACVLRGLRLFNSEQLRQKLKKKYFCRWWQLTCRVFLVL